MNGLYFDMIDASLFMVSSSQILDSLLTLLFNKSRVEREEGGAQSTKARLIDVYPSLPSAHSLLTPRHTLRRNTESIRAQKLAGNINIHCQENYSLST